MESLHEGPHGGAASATRSLVTPPQVHRGAEEGWTGAVRALERAEGASLEAMEWLRTARARLAHPDGSLLRWVEHLLALQQRVAVRLEDMTRAPVLGSRGERDARALAEVDELFQLAEAELLALAAGLRRSPGTAEALTLASALERGWVALMGWRARMLDAERPCGGAQ